MRNLCILCCLLLSAFSIKAQNRLETDAKGRTLLLGKFDESILEHGAFAQWYVPYKSNYKPKPAVMTNLKPMIKGRRFELFMGTWCGDSKRGVPQLLKVFEGLEVSDDQLEMIAVDYRGNMYKKSPGKEEVGKNITRVPTLIIYEGETEIGRIIERPHKNWEADMLALLSKKGNL
ncbi:thioredoxin family protein [Sediminicola luteus]|uniref:thioredoxin family protein n=1 Tax=Sediminicola luteus TaxID=319238 RepID=UPI0011436573|nr:thioredoxin family protein [Sediminicola luteus]